MTTGERTQCRRASGPGCSEDGGIDIWPEMARSRWRQAWSTRSAHSSHCIALRCARRTRVNALKKILPWRGIEPRFRRRQRRVLATIRPQRRLPGGPNCGYPVHAQSRSHTKPPRHCARHPAAGPHHSPLAPCSRSPGPGPALRAPSRRKGALWSSARQVRAWAAARLAVGPGSGKGGAVASVCAVGAAWRRFAAVWSGWCLCHGCVAEIRRLTSAFSVVV